MTEPDDVQAAILAELQSIRYRLGVLIVWFVVIPLVAGLIVWTVVGASQ